MSLAKRPSSRSRCSRTLGEKRNQVPSSFVLLPFVLNWDQKPAWPGRPTNRLDLIEMMTSRAFKRKTVSCRRGGERKPPCCCAEGSLSSFKATLALGPSVHLLQALICVKTPRLVDQRLQPMKTPKYIDIFPAPLCKQIRLVLGGFFLLFFVFFVLNVFAILGGKVGVRIKMGKGGAAIIAPRRLIDSFYVTDWGSIKAVAQFSLFFYYSIHSGLTEAALRPLIYTVVKRGPSHSNSQLSESSKRTKE